MRKPDVEELWDGGEEGKRREFTKSTCGDQGFPDAGVGTPDHVGGKGYV